MGEPPEFIGDNREQVELDLMQETDTSESGALARWKELRQLGAAGCLEPEARDFEFGREFGR